MKQDQSDNFSPQKKGNGKLSLQNKSPPLRQKTLGLPQKDRIVQQSPKNNTNISKFTESEADELNKQVMNVPYQAPIFDFRNQNTKKIEGLNKNRPSFGFGDNGGVGDGLYQATPKQLAEATPHFTGVKNFEQNQRATSTLEEPNAWRGDQDPLKMYQLDKYFKMGDVNGEVLKELSRWKQADTKGVRRTQYIKTVQSNNDLILITVEQSRLEKLQSYEDRWPCLNVRKIILKISISINEVATKIVSHRAFETCSIIVILFNSAVLVLEGPGSGETGQSVFEKKIEQTFLILYTIEMGLKILSKGFVLNKGAYLRDAFNILDFVIVMSSYLTIIQEKISSKSGSKKKGSNIFGGLRVFRVLRPLRSITTIQGLKILMLALLSSLPLLKDTIIVLIFFLLIFAIAGTQLIQGVTKYRCVDLNDGTNVNDPLGYLDDSSFLCGSQKCKSVLNQTPDSARFVCLKANYSPNYGVTNYDNIFWGFITTFQNISLEGWSDTQKYFEMSSGKLYVFFFTGCAYMGAFFLLNLTMAVINSQFSKTHEEYQKKHQVEKEKKQKALKIAKQKQEGGDDDNLINNQNLEKEDVKELGFYEFFIAKRAAKKMIEFLANRRIENQKKKDELERKQKEELESDRQLDLYNKSDLNQFNSNPEVTAPPVLEQEDKGSLLRQKKQAIGILRKQTHMQQQEYDSQRRSSQRNSQSPRFNQGSPERSREKQNSNFQLDYVKEHVITQNLLKIEKTIDENKTITEEDSDSLNHSQQVAKFLQDLESDHHSRIIDKNEGPFNKKDVDLSANKLMGLNQFENGMRNGIQGNSYVQKRINQNKMSDQMSAKNIFDELALDKVIAEEHLQPQNVQTTKKPSDEKKDSLEENSLQLSWDYPQYMSDDDVKNVQRTFDEDKSSIISSDSSLRYNMQNHDETQAKENQAKKQTFPTEKRAIAKDLRKRIRRMNTTENKKEEIATQKSTYYREENSIKPSLAQSSPFFSGSQRKGPTIIDQVTSPKNTQGEKTPNTAKKKTDDTRKKIKETYQNIDDKFLMYKKPKDFTLFIDKKKKKIDINPGIKYDGSSLGEIFEFRFIQQQRKVISSINKFMKPVSNENEQEELNYDDDYIEPLFDPYQLKCVYNIKEVEQIEFDSDDDDNLILAIQPYDTVTSIGHSDKLVHLPTKFLSRRSDIIVSATMSITLTPQDDQYVPINKNNMDEEQIFNWVTLRNEFRALKIHQAQLVEEDDTENSEVSESKSVISISEAEISQHISENGKPNLRRGQTLNINQKFDEKKKNAITYSSKLPKNGLSEQLKPAEIQALDEDQKIAYSKWKGKYEASLRLLKKRNDDPHQAEQQLSLEDAQKMFSGTFFDQIGDDEEKQAGVEQTDNKTFFINRDQNQLKNDLDLDGFEQAVALIASENAMNEDKEKVDDQFCKLLQKDVIPDEIRREFDIPEETAGNIIDFNEIRRSDASRKRKTPIWSGQDVLYISLNRDSSNQIVEKINTLRVWPQGFFGAFKRIRFIARKFITHPIMDNLMTLIVLINTIVMTLDRYNIPQDEQKRNKMLSSIFTYTFIAEFGIKMFALGPKKYTDNTFNILDGTIVMLSLVELTMMKGNGALSAFRSVRVFRMFRVLRIARILRGLKAMQQIISVITRSASSFLYIGMLLMLFIFIFALIGMTIFGGKLNFPGQSNGGYNYDSFNKAFFSSFDTLTMENWNTQLYYGIESHQNKIIVCVYYIAWIFLGNFVILNLFLAILLDSFLEEDDEDEDSDEAIAAQKAADDLKKQQVQKEKKRRLKKMGKNMSKLQTENSIFQNNDQAEKKKANPFQKTQKEILIDDIDDLDEDKIKDYLIELKHYKLEKHQIKPITFEDAEIVCKKSLFIFSKENVFRKKMLAIAKNKNFDNFIMALILLSSMKLAIDTHFEEKYNSITLANTIQDSIDKIFTILFTFEMVIKIITMGFVMDHGSYIRESWNQLDFFIVVTSLLDLMLTKVKLKAVKTIRLLRILRPLRFISHNKGMKMIVSALLDSGSGLGNVIVVILMVWLMFAILAVNLFSGKMFFCTIGQYENHTKRACNEAGGSWARRFTNYDNVGQAMLALFCIQTFEGWPDRMHETQQIVAVDKGPKMENRVIVGYFFVAYILVGSYFFMNFFVGVLFLKYTDAKKREIKGYSQEHLNWIDIQKLIEKAKVDHAFRYKPRNSKFRVALWKIVNANWFNNLIMATIMLNTCQMAMSFDGQPKWYTNALSYSNYVFTAIFIIEAILKLLCYHTSYFFTTWNKFDFFVVSTSIIDLLMQISSIISGKGGGHKTNLKALKAAPQLARILRVMRISRILRLAGKNEGLQALLMTIQMSIGPLSNVLVLLMLSLAMFSILGNSLFKNAFQSDAINTLSQIDPNYKNFKNFINGFILVLVLSTGENWPIVMNELSNSKPNCIDTTCGSKLSPVYFILFVLLIQKIMLNLFVLVIIEQFEQYYVSDDNPIQKFKSNLILFETVWIKFTEKYDHVKIKEKFLISFFQSLSLPIGFREQDKDETKEEYEADMKKQMLKMGIRCEDGFIFFNELLYRCMRKQYGNFKLNKNMTLIEINTQFQLLKLRWGQQKQSKQEPQDQKVFVKKLVGTGLAFNPFMTVMYFRISFNKWLNMTRMSMQKKQCEALEQMRKEALDKGESFHPSEFTLLNQEADKQYRIFVDKEEIFYITDEDDDDNELHSLRQSKSIRQFGMSSKSPEEARQKSPEVHRLRSQYLKKSLTKRFTTSGFRIQKTTPQSPSPGEQEQQSVNLQTPGNQLQRLGLDECKKKRNTVIIDSQTLSQLHKKVFAKESPSSDLKLAKRQQITKSPPNLD